MPSTPTTGNTWVDLFLFLLVLLLGGSSGGAINAWRKDRREDRLSRAATDREDKSTEVALTETLQRIAETALERQEDRHAEEREQWRHERAELLRRVDAQDDEVEVLRSRVRQLEQAMVDAKVPVPRPLRVVGGREE